MEQFYKLLELALADGELSDKEKEKYRNHQGSIIGRFVSEHFKATEIIKALCKILLDP